MASTSETTTAADQDTKQSADVEKGLGDKETGTALPSSSASLDETRIQDEEKALPVNESGKDAVEDSAVEHDPNVVDWDENDPDNPYNWTAKKKWLNIGVLAAVTFLTPLASSFFAPAVPRLMADFNSTSEITATFVVSVFVFSSRALFKQANRGADTFSASQSGLSS